jgi:hypothetical protein
MFSSNLYRRSYKKLLEPLDQTVTIMINNGVGFDSYPCKAYVSKYREQDLVAGGSIETGDLRLIMMAECVPATVSRMDKGDRIEIDGRVYAVIHFDDYTRRMGEDIIAYEIAVRG